MNAVDLGIGRGALQCGRIYKDAEIREPPRD